MLGDQQAKNKPSLTAQGAPQYPYQTGMPSGMPYGMHQTGMPYGMHQTVMPYGMPQTGMSGKGFPFFG